MIDLFYYFRKKIIDPLSSLRVTERWLNSLSLKDEYQAHKHISDALNIFNSSTDPLTKERLQILMRLDEGSQLLQKNLCDIYLKKHASDPELEQKLWKCIFANFWHLAHGYQAFIRDYLDHPEQSEISKMIPLITVRAIHYLSGEIKWRYFHQEMVQPNMWKRLHKLYRLSELHGFSNEKVTIAGGSSESSCMMEYFRILMLDMLVPTSLQIEQIELVEQWLMRWAEVMHLDNHYAENRHTHFIDLSKPAGAGKIVPETEGEKLRFWDISPLLAEVTRSLRLQREGKQLDRIGIEGKYCDSACLDFMEQLSTLWMTDSAARVYPRELSDNKTVEVVCGISCVISMLDSHSSNSESCSLNALSAKWPIENESATGYGLIIHSDACSNAEVGRLIGVRDAESNGPWKIGAIRWVKNAESGKISLGVEKLSDSPRAVKIERLELAQLHSENLQEQAGIITADVKELRALFLPNVDNKGMASSLILPISEFTAGKIMDLHDKQLTYKIRFTEILENSEDWARIKFDILGRRSRAA
ncbi:hypothetical protein [Sulfurirhabdus autotrophica]|uniref:Uncharacterized protein n=1 Tax=Sulfurirhabdus autotrophica TaxID=1706046 RepID=A0A4R3YIG2_9PROT|nr:hypothetical protein [Sulfurirhabdus autotrophica]TCV90443.1 hypothetical protein EDC63_101416 [Sulfurirhabdus autotrophica]